MTTIVPAAAWSRRTWRPLATIPTPAPRLWVHHGAVGTPTLATLRAYEAYHVDNKGWAALGYSFAITGDGTIYEGRGWGRQGAHTAGDNTRSHGVVLVGDWTRGTVPQPMVDALAALVRDGHRRRACPLAITGGHRQAPNASTVCPGAAGMDAIVRARRLLTASEGTTVAPKPGPYPDVPADHPHAEGIAAVKDLMKGKRDGTFDPDGPVTRGQLATVLHRLTTR